jgi:hypothetical protein
LALFCAIGSFLYVSLTAHFACLQKDLIGNGVRDLYEPVITIH